MRLAQSVEQFATLVAALSDADLERPWSWQDYDEGLRFALLRTAEELRQLAADLAAERAGLGQPLTTAQRLLGSYHTAWRELQFVLLGLEDSLAAQATQQDEWPVLETLHHVVSADCGFLFTILACLGAHDPARWSAVAPAERTEEAWNTFWSGKRFTFPPEAPGLSELLTYSQGLHQGTLDVLSDLSEAELELPVEYWEKTPYPLSFRLIRFESHLRQHTIQIEKALQQLVGPPSEARRLLRWVYIALAEAENALLGSQAGEESCQVFCEILDERVQEIKNLLAA